ncbi:MAG: aldehyde dehydrogenase [Mesorhizobium sp.]|nr:MAG: aldehyde dehydrogenase [Mesorhizobium sp.]
MSQPARDFLSRARHGLFIDGKGVNAAESGTIDVQDPSTGAILGTIAAGGTVDVNRAVSAARAAFEGPWSKWTPYERQSLLFRAAELMERHYDDLAQVEAIDMGAPITRVRASKPGMMRMIQFFAAMALNIRGDVVQSGLPGDVTALILKAPVGVVGGIIPWNGPLNSQWWILGAVLATGCTAVIKPAEDASLSVLWVVELLHGLGLPPGVLNVVTGRGSEAGEALASHPGVDRIAFTGSTATGRRIINASAVNMKRLQLELGGKSPDIVFADADLDKAVPGAAMGVFANSGQICYAGTRLLVQRNVHDEFTARMGEFLEKLRLGRSLDPSVQLGPVISARQFESVMSYIEVGRNEGAQLAFGGSLKGDDLKGGYFVPPTVFTNVNNDMTIAREEIFGPVVSIIPFDTLDEAVAIGNETEYGLGGAVWSKDISTALSVVKRIHTGVMWVNCYGLIDPLVGFGGTKMSGYGAKGSEAHLDTYLYSKCVYIQG